ncbi:hypothetical protein DRO64_10640 [Candidatus Bathyarchaeota archaeon]|nr:MAG: hypothetical protein DRO64_10640 [Candidatus Bathyarchaeota archaeon]
MARKTQTVERDVIEDVYRFIEDYIFENHKLCSISEIINSLKIARRRCDRILKELIRQGKITVVYEGAGKPTIYIPTYMFEEILRAQYKPRWIEKYAFKRKSGMIKKINEMRKEISHYEILERLLYGTGEPLEEAVKYALEYLEFENVERPQEKDTYDVSFTYNEKKYIVEVEGTTKQGSKEKVNQLDGWIKKELNMDTDPSRIIGVFIVNHFRDKDPEERGEPLTEHAKRFLKYHRFVFFTTWFLFNLVKKVDEDSLSKEEARKMVVKGEKYA